MKKIINKTYSPLQLMVRSRKSVSFTDSEGKVRGSGSRNFTTVSIPGIGSNNNIYYLEDEKMTPQIEMLESKKLIKIESVK